MEERSEERALYNLSTGTTRLDLIAGKGQWIQSIPGGGAENDVIRH